MPSNRPYALSVALWIALLVALLLPTSARAEETPYASLNGRWHFALDPLGLGELYGWHRLSAAEMDSYDRWDVVSVPHSWPADPRYKHTGKAWYRRTFEGPVIGEGQVIRLAFDGVFYKARVWVNGQPVGTHEGGYTPFEIDITGAVVPGPDNLIAVEVDNTLDLTTVPAIRPGAAPIRQVMPWWDFGGIVRDVVLLVSPDLYVDNQRIVATPDLNGGAADIEATVWITNTTGRVRRATVALTLRREGRADVLAGGPGAQALQASVEVMPYDTRPVSFRLSLPAYRVELWHFDRPNLYEMTAAAAGDGGAEHQTTAVFGIRKVEIDGTRLLLNGEAVKMGGANRHLDHPVLGMSEPDSLVEMDMRLMKEANMMLQRMHHYPPAPAVYDWADRNGMLIIAEPGNWQLAPQQMDDPVIRAKWRRQMEEMIYRDWNHPSVIGWSLGNEYLSETPAGLRWTRDMYRYTKTLDDSRFVTFAGLGSLLADTDVPPEARGPEYVDLVSVNIYGSPENAAKALDRAHRWWPDKPILITEWGVRADQVADDAARTEYNRAYIDTLRERDYVVGASIWTYNDYSSRYPGTNPDGYRPWGVVDIHRRPRPAYFTLRDEFAPAVIDGEASRSSRGVAGRFRIMARKDFPRYTLTGYSVRMQALDRAGNVLAEQTGPLPELKPGASAEVSLTAAAPKAVRVRVDLMRPTGFSAADRSFTLR